MSARFFLSIPDATLVKDPYEEVFSLFTTETTDTPWAHNRSVSQQSTRLEVELDFTPAPSPTVSQPGSRPGSRGAGSYFQSLGVVEPGTVTGSGSTGGESPLMGSRETFSSSPGPLSFEEVGGNSNSLVLAQTNGRENSLPKVKSPAARAILNSRKSSRGGAGGSSSPRSATPQPTKKPVVIHQSLSTLSQPGQTGTVVWDSSILMSKFLLSIKGLSTRCYRTEEGRRLRKELRENRRRRERERREREQVRMLEERADRLAITANGELVDSEEDGPIVGDPHDIDNQDMSDDDGDDDDDGDMEFDDEDGDDDNAEEEEDKPVFDPAETTILELGSGCGLLGIVMAELCQDLLLTDQKPVLPLLVKNLRKNLDKKYFDQDLLNGSNSSNGTTASRKKDRLSAATAASTPGTTDVRPCHIQVQELVWGQDLDQDLKRGMGVDFVVATDVVYNESIVPKLVQTLQELCEIREGVREEIRQGQGEHFDQLQEQASARPRQRMRKLERTVVLLAQELRTDYVHLAFLEGLEQAGFRMVRIPREMMDNDYQSGYVIYAFFLRGSASIGPHLTLVSLHACVLVSNDWRTTFTPFLWKTFYFGPHKGDISLDPPSQATIQLYAHHIQTLIVRRFTAVTFQLHIFRNTPLTQLKELYLSEAGRESRCTSGLGWLFLQNPGLRVVDYDGGHSKFRDGGDNYYDDILGLEQGQGQGQVQKKEEEDFRVLLSRCPALRDLTTRYVEYDKEHRELLRRLCETRLKRMSFCINKFHYGIDMSGAIRMQHLQELFIRSNDRNILGHFYVPGLETILECPNLRVLRWLTASVDLTAAIFRQIFGACPRLEAIELQQMVLADDVIASMLEAMQASATEVILPGRKEPPLWSGVDEPSVLGFKTRAFAALERRHFATLVVLNMGTHSKEVTSPMILRVLSACPRLREITACQVLAKEVRDGPGVWACRGLQVFRVKIRGCQDPLIRTAVFRRFATLPRLRVLHIGGQDWEEENIVLRLDCGMGQLAGLEKLESVSVYGGPQKMTREDVEWIREHWTGLRVLDGDLHPIGEVSEAIREVLTAPRDSGRRRKGEAEKTFGRFAFYTVNHRYKKK